MEKKSYSILLLDLRKESDVKYLETQKYLKYRRLRIMALKDVWLKSLLINVFLKGEKMKVTFFLNVGKIRIRSEADS